MERYCNEIAESGIERVQILSPFRSEGASSAEQLNDVEDDNNVACISGRFSLYMYPAAVLSSSPV